MLIRSPGFKSYNTMNTASRILIVDDEPAILFLLEKILTSEGYQVSTAASGDEALAACREHWFDLVIIDLIMPVKDGIETMLSLRARQKHTPVVAMSGGWNGGVHNCLPLAGKLGACSTLAKPFDRAALMEVVGREVRKPRRAQRVGALPLT